ncbi:bacteriophage N4 receptor, outer membrane subunit [Hartmannibacter diazotrophicus]|uniref:Bacteriophage N4 receptor, outer membrane subunit n=2 Tax=Hartmannibacter diazotrophicus TaxID=1482074 RepID=A0A2C9D2M9_9HYPH|nr:bacteriophage N4 receptor, outer membrane subunit [Hartmannibacter diazotrophicus]
MCRSSVAVSRQPRLRMLSLALPLACGVFLSACASQQAVGTHGGATITGSTNLTDDQLASAARSWGQRYDQNPKDRGTILNYAAALRLSGNTDQAIAVLQQGVIQYKDDRVMAASYGKALAANGDFQQALEVIRRAQRPDRPDWALLSAEGAILDQIGNGASARDLYGKALAIVPDEPSVLNNLGLSYLLSGNLEKSEEVLRRASVQPRANSRIRQNLALVLGLEGKFSEAEAVARNEINPDQAAANISYLKAMMAQADRWKEIEAGEKKTRQG